MGLLTDRINNKLEKCNLINEHALNRELVPLKEKYRFEKGASYHHSRSGHNVGLCTNGCGLSYKS